MLGPKVEQRANLFATALLIPFVTPILIAIPRRRRALPRLSVFDVHESPSLFQCRIGGSGGQSCNADIELLCEFSLPSHPYQPSQLSRSGIGVSVSSQTKIYVPSQSMYVCLCRRDAA